MGSGRRETAPARGRSGAPAVAFRRWSLQAKASLLLGAVAALPLLLVGLFLLRDAEQTVRAQVIEEVGASAVASRALAQQYVGAVRLAIEALAGQPGLLGAARMGDGVALRATLEWALPYLDLPLEALAWLDDSGTLRATSGPDLAPDSYTRELVAPADLAAALAVSTSTIGPPGRAPGSERPVVPLIVPVRDGPVTRGALVASLDLHALTNALAPVQHRAARRLAVVDLRTGRYLAHPDPAALLTPLADTTLLARLRAGEAGALERAEGPEGPHIAGYAALPALGWGIVVVEPLPQAVAIIEGVETRGRLALVVAVGVAMGLGWLLARRLTRPLRELQQATARLAAGERGVVVPVRGDDEFGQVAASFNAMSRALAAAHAAEAQLRRAAEGAADREALLNRINARIRASLDVDTVLRATLEELGTTLGAARAFIALERDGQLGPIDYEWTRPGVPPASVHPPRRLALFEQALRERRVIAVTDLDAPESAGVPALAPRARSPEHNRALLVAPLLLGDTRLGVLGLHEVGAPRTWRPDEIALVEAVAGEAAVALANARLYADAQSRAQRLAVVARINRAISAHLDLATVLGVVAETLGQLVPFDTCHLARLEPDGTSYRVLSATPATSPPTGEGDRIPLAGNRLEALLRDPRPVAHADLADPAVPLTPRERQFLAAGFRSLVLVPVLADRDWTGAPPRLLGALSLASREPGRYGAAEIEVLELVAGQLAVAVRNADLYAEILASEQRLETIVAGIADGVFLTDPAGRIAVWNQAAERLLGYPAAEALGRPWPEIIRGLDARGRPLLAAVREAAAALRQGERVVHDEALLITRDGTERWVSLSVSLLTMNHGRHWAVVFRDISAYKELDRRKSDFVATVSHELRTPLASIKGYAATLLQRGDRLPPEVRAEYLQIINDEANRLNALVSDLLEVARLERGEVQPELVPTALAPLAARVADRVARAQRAAASAAAAPRHRFVVAVPPDLWAIAAPARLEQVLTNLVENAVKYSPLGGAIVIEGGQRGPETVYLAVTDEGIGIAADRQAELFRPFARVEHALTRATEGVGLGLYICKLLIERMGGTIALASVPDRGTTVTVTLAAAQPPADAEDG